MSPRIRPTQNRVAAQEIAAHIVPILASHLPAARRRTDCLKKVITLAIEPLLFGMYKSSRTRYRWEARLAKWKGRVRRYRQERDAALAQVARLHQTLFDMRDALRDTTPEEQAEISQSFDEPSYPYADAIADNKAWATKKKTKAPHTSRHASVPPRIKVRKHKPITRPVIPSTLDDAAEEERAALAALQSYEKEAATSRVNQKKLEEETPLHL